MKALKLPKTGIWQKLEHEAKKPVRQRAEMNLSRLESLTKDGQVVLFPGKVLGTGSFARKITLAARAFTKSARERIEKSGSKIVPYSEVAKSHPKGTNVLFLK